MKPYGKPTEAERRDAWLTVYRKHGMAATTALQAAELRRRGFADVTTEWLRAVQRV